MNLFVISNFKYDFSRNPNYPVMFWIHGGGYAFGSGNTFLYGPDFLVAQDVLVVTINYRLGPFGFLSAGRDAPGNAGLKVSILRSFTESRRKHVDPLDTFRYMTPIHFNNLKYTYICMETCYV